MSTLGACNIIIIELIFFGIYSIYNVLFMNKYNIFN